MRGKFSWVVGVLVSLLIERKQCVKCCELIIADRYRLPSHFFAADRLELGIWVVSCLSQVIGMEGKNAHILVDMQPQGASVRERERWREDQMG